MKTPRTLVATGVACFLLFLLAGIPASLITDRLASDTERFEGVSGTIWSGEIRSLNLAGINLRDVRWNLQGLQLLLGRAALDIDARLPGGTAKGTVAIGLTGSITASAFEVSTAVEAFADVLKLPQVGGRLMIQIENLSIHDAWPKEIVGTANISGFPLLPDGTAPGSFQVTFLPDAVGENGRLRGEIKDLDGPLEVNGTVELTPPGNYELRGRVRARGDAPSDLINGLALLGPVDAGGQREFSIAGSI